MRKMATNSPAFSNEAALIYCGFGILNAFMRIFFSACIAGHYLAVHINQNIEMAEFHCRLKDVVARILHATSRFCSSSHHNNGNT